MSRRKVEEKERKTVRVTFRMDAELAELMAGRAEEMGMGMSEYLRSLAEEKPMVRLQTKQDLQKIKYELSMIGTNLNQIAHALNGAYYRYPNDAARVSDALSELRKVLDKIMQAY